MGEETRRWAEPIRARRFHVFEGLQSLCGKWMLRTDENDPEVDPEADTYREGEDCKECSRKAGVLDG